MTRIKTYTGREFDFSDPQPWMIAIEDIAHALSNCCRFCGQTREFYSVAQHSVLVSELLPILGAGRMNPAQVHEYELTALLHDASECYTGDVVTPLKKMLPDFQRVEDAVTEAIKKAFDLRTWDELVKQADREALAIEGDFLMPGRNGEYGSPVTDTRILVNLMPQQAKALFMRRFEALMAIRTAKQDGKAWGGA